LAADASIMDVRSSRRAFAAEAREDQSTRRQRRRSEQLDKLRAAEVPRCASTPIRGMATMPRGCVPSVAMGSVRKKLGAGRFALSSGGGGGGGDGGDSGAHLGDEWLAASVKHVRELARKTVTKAALPHSRRLASREGATGSREARRRRRAELPAGEELLSMDRLHALDPEEDAKQRRRKWAAELQEKVREQRKLLSKMKVDKSLRADRLASLAEKLAVADAAESKTMDLVPAADTKLIIVRARFDETVRETGEMARYADTLALMQERAKDALHDAKVRAERLQVAFGTLSNEVANTKSLLLTLEEARAAAAKQRTVTAKQLADSSAANSEKTLALQDRVAVIDPDVADEVELEVQAVREKKRKQRLARKEAKAAEAKAKEEQVAASLALTTARRNQVDGAIRRIHAATGIFDQDVLLEKFLADRETNKEAKRKAAAAESRVECLREELKAAAEEESKAFLEYNPDKERLALRTKALRPRTSTLQAAEAKLARCRDRAKTQRLNLLVSGSQISALLQKACDAVGDVPPARRKEAVEQQGAVDLEALENLLVLLLSEVHTTETIWEDSDSSCSDAGEVAVGDVFSDVTDLAQYESSEYGRMELTTTTAAQDADQVTRRANDKSFLPSIFHDSGGDFSV
jgi:hypothetical protein